MGSQPKFWETHVLPPEHYESVDDAWRCVLRSIKNGGNWIDSVKDESSIGSGFGSADRPYKELQSLAFTITNPRKRVVLSEVRKVNFPFAMANFVWTLSGSPKIEMIVEYNARGAYFSDDGVSLASAFGTKLFGKEPTQFQRVSELLRSDPSTRRAVINLFDDGALERHSKDISCALAIHFLRRNGRLDCILYMRSQSAAMVMPYDLFLFTMIHECMAAELGIPLGEYTHVCSSLHYYRDEEAVVHRILDEMPAHAEPMEEMPSFSDAERRAILKAEADIRTLVTSKAGMRKDEFTDVLAGSCLNSYWKKVFYAFFGWGLQTRLRAVS